MRDGVLPDGPTARGAATSWLVYLVWVVRAVSGLALLGADYFLDAVVVASPVDDALFDGLGLQVLGEGSVSKGGKFFVGGEAKGDELFDR